MKPLPEDFAFPPDSFVDACIYTTYDLNATQVSCLVGMYDTEVSHALRTNGYDVDFSEAPDRDFAAGISTTDVTACLHASMSNYGYVRRYVISGILSKRNLTTPDLYAVMNVISMQELLDVGVVAQSILLHPACSDELKLELTLKYG